MTREGQENLFNAAKYAILQHLCIVANPVLSNFHASQFGNFM